MTPDELARFRAMIEAMDTAVAARPDLLASPAGFILGALVGAGTHDPVDAWRQLAGFADVLAYIVVHVRTGEGDPAVIVRSFLPDAEAGA
jgi:hypothetical protein